MAASQQQITTDILNHIKKRGGTFADWYVGISKDASDRLFNGHSVDKKVDGWIYRTASSSTVARAVEKHFCRELGTDGDCGGGDASANQVYAYKKSTRTDP